MQINDIRLHFIINRVTIPARSTMAIDRDSYKMMSCFENNYLINQSVLAISSPAYSAPPVKPPLYKVGQKVSC